MRPASGAAAAGLFLAALALGTGARSQNQTEDEIIALRNSPIHAGPEPRTCPERRAFGFCFYDTGWLPATDNPAFQPMRRSDPEPELAPLCTIYNRRGAKLGMVGEEGALMLRIQGRAIHFQRTGDAAGGRDYFRAPEGRLIIEDGAIVAQALEWVGNRARLIFTDRRGRRQIASVRIDCGS